MKPTFLRWLRESVAASSMPALQRADNDQDDDRDDLEESVPQAERDKDARNGDAFSDGSFPITTQKQADDAWDLRGHDENHSEAAIIAHIRRQVQKHGLKMPGENHARESVLLHALLREAAIEQTSPGVYEATIIQEGAGNPTDANYYTKDALREAVASGKFEGLRAYLNHPTRTEERERPERDVRFLAGHFREARFVDGNPARVVAKFVPGGMDVDKVRNLLESAIRSPADRPLVGISIDGAGYTPDKQTINGRTYNMVREIAHLGSADIVTQTATGGRFHRALQEASLTTGSISRPDTSKEVVMTAAEFQQKVKAAHAKLSEAAGLDGEKDAERAEALLREGMVLLRECDTATIEPEVKIQEKIVEKPVAATDGETDRLAARLQEATTALEAEQAAHAETLGELKTIKAGQAAIKVMREKQVPEKLQEAWYTSVAAQQDEATMGVFVDSKLAERDAILTEFRESVGIEGAGPRIPAPAPTNGGDLLALAGVRNLDA